jgi:hypothetical protein
MTALLCIPVALLLAVVAGIDVVASVILQFIKGE